MKRDTCIVVCLAMLFATHAHANYLDLTHTLADTGTFGPATFTGNFEQPVGTGTFKPFWRAQQHGNDPAYEFFNTNARPLAGDLAAGNNANGGDITNRTFLVSSLAAVNGNYVFILDSNEPNSVDKAVISIDKFVLRTSVNDELNTFSGLAGANLIYDIDGGHTCVASSANGSQATCGPPPDSNGVLLTETLNPGSGKTNLAVLVPTILFAGHLNEYLYLDVQFGMVDDAQAQAGFEEWSALTAVPEPGFISIIGMGATAALFLIQKRRTRRAGEPDRS